MDSYELEVDDIYQKAEQGLKPFSVILGKDKNTAELDLTAFNIPDWMMNPKQFVWLKKQKKKEKEKGAGDETVL